MKEPREMLSVSKRKKSDSSRKKDFNSRKRRRDSNVKHFATPSAKPRSTRSRRRGRSARSSSRKRWK